MKAGFYKNEMVEIEADSIDDAAQLYADEHHEIYEQSDLEFKVYILDDEGIMHKVDMYTEYDPRYEVSKITKDGN